MYPVCYKYLARSFLSYSSASFNTTIEGTEVVFVAICIYLYLTLTIAFLNADVKWKTQIKFINTDYRIDFYW